MTAFLLTMLLIGQRVPFAAEQASTVAGVLRNFEGGPAARVRVAAMVRPDSPGDLGGGTAMASVSETDENGRFLLENIPPGQYYVVAGRVDLPTFYPGTQDVSAGTVIKTGPGETLTGIDFVLRETSVRSLYMDAASALTSVKANIRATGTGGRFPVSSISGVVKLQFTRTLDGSVTEAALTAPSVNLPISVSPPGAEFRVRVINLPSGFILKSITRGPVDVTNDTLKLAPASNPAALLGILGLPGVQTSTGISVPSSALGLGAMIVATAQGASTLFFASQLALAEDLIVTIEAGAPPAGIRSGVRITGMARRSDTHPVYMSGVPGIVFSDGSFEFQDVRPGRHTIATLDSPGRAVGATIVVGDRDLDKIELDDIAASPADIQTPRAPGPANGLLPGSRLPQMTIRGKVLDEMTQQPLPTGKVFISGARSPWYQLDEEGRFEIPHLLPGVYNLEIQIFGHADIIQEIQVGVDDVVLNLTATNLP